MMNESNKALQFFIEWQATLALILGTLMQFILLEKKSAKAAITLIVASSIVGMFIIPFILTIGGLPKGSEFANFLYASSSMISLPLLAMFITMAPQAIRERAKRFMEEDGRDANVQSKES